MSQRASCAQRCQSKTRLRFGDAVFIVIVVVSIFINGFKLLRLLGVDTDEITASVQNDKLVQLPHSHEYDGDTAAYIASNNELGFCSDPSTWAKDDQLQLVYTKCSSFCIIDMDIPHLTYEQKPNIFFEECVCACLLREEAAVAENTEGVVPRKAKDVLSLASRCPVEASDFAELLEDSSRLAKTFYVGGRSMPAWKSAATAKGLAMITDKAQKRKADFYHDYSKENAKSTSWTKNAWKKPQKALQFWNKNSMGFHNKARFAECTQGLDHVVPATFQLPAEAAALSAYDHARRQYSSANDGDDDTTWVFKPKVGSGGYGVQRVNTMDKLLSMGAGIAQAYIPSYLLEGRKFDLRLYVLVTSLEPLQAYIHTDGMVRLAYSAQGKGEKKSANGNVTNCTFITNISQRKNCVKANSKEDPELLRDRHAVKSRYVWRIPALKDYINTHGAKSMKDRDFDAVWHDIEVAVAQTLLACQLRECVSFQNLGDAGARSYFTLGFDIAIDTKLKVWVMEVNQRPDDNSSVGPFGMFPDSPYLQGRAMQKFSFAALGLLGLPTFDRRAYGCSILRLLRAFCRDRHEFSRRRVHGHCSTDEEAVLLRLADEYFQLDEDIMHPVLPLRPGSSMFEAVKAQLPSKLWEQYQSADLTDLMQSWLALLLEVLE